MVISTTRLCGTVGLANSLAHRIKTFRQPHIDSFDRMYAFPSPAISSFGSLPTELILIICSHLSTYDLFVNVRPSSRVLYICAREILLKKIFQESQVHFSWCCFWCSLGDHSLIAVSKGITPLFSTPANVQVEDTGEDALVAKLAFGDICRTVCGQQTVRIGIGGHGAIAVETKKLQKCLHFGSQNQEEQRYGFLVFYFARLRRETRRWRIASGLAWASRILGLVVVGTGLLVVVSSSLVIFWVGLETFKSVVGLWRFGNSVRGVVAEYVGGWWKGWSTRPSAMIPADITYSGEFGEALDEEDYAALPGLWLS
jgi:hypothetical protein